MKLFADICSNPHAKFVAKTFLVGYSGQAILTFGPMLGDPASILIALTNPNFDFNFVNLAFGKALMAAWGILLTSPYDSTSSPSTLTQIPIKVDLKDK